MDGVSDFVLIYWANISIDPLSYPFWSTTSLDNKLLYYYYLLSRSVLYTAYPSEELREHQRLMDTSPGASSSAAASNINTTHMSPIPRSPAHRRDTSSESCKKRIPSEQWEAKRGIITQLYQDEKKSLKEVMGYLEKEHGFTAT